MQRSTGVLTVAIVVLVGSILVLALGVLTAGFALVIPHIPPPEGRPPLPLAGVMLLASLTYVLPGIWGVVSGIGLLKLKNWARISTVVFAVFAGFGGASLLIVALWLLSASLPATDEITPAAAVRGLAVARALLGFMSLTLLGVAVWFGILLTRPNVVLQFGGAEGLAGRRPLSVTIIAVLMLIAVPMMCVGIIIGSPATVFFTILTGRAAAVYYLAIAATLAFSGWGLLRLKPAARIVAIVYFLFAILSSAVFFVAPGREARMTALMNHQARMILVPSSGEVPKPTRPTVLMLFGLVGGFVGAVVPLYFLIARRAAFEPPTIESQKPEVTSQM